MGPSASDKSEVGILHATSSGVGLSRNYRDASNPDVDSSLSIGQEKKSPWKNVPTFINPPRNEDPVPVPRAVPNPYAGGRMKTTMNGSAKRSNRQTVLSTTTPKKTRADPVLSEEAGRKPLSLSDRPSAGNPLKLNHNTKGHFVRSYVSDLDIIVVSDEDTGEPIPKMGESSKPNKTLPSTSRNKRQRSDSPDPIDAWCHSSVGPSIYPDGPNTASLRDRIQPLRVRTPIITRVPAMPDQVSGYSSDPIEDASTFDGDVKTQEPPRVAKLTGSFVRTRIEAIETKQQDVEAKQPIRVLKPKPAFREVDLMAEEAEARKASLENAVKPKLRPAFREVDFVAEAKKASLKNAMKPKSSSRPVARPDILSNSSGFAPRKPRTRRESQKESQREVGLPLEAWMRGLELHQSTDDTQYWAFLSNELVLAIRDGPNSPRPARFKTNLRTGASSIEMTPAPWDFKHGATMKIRTEGPRPFGGTDSDLFKLGSKGLDGTITLRFSTTGPNWQLGHGFNDFHKIIDDDESITWSALRGPASDSAWDLIQEAIKAHHFAQTDGVVEPPEGSKSSSVPIQSTSSSIATRRQPPRVARSARLSSRPEYMQDHSPPPPDLDQVILVYPQTGTGAVRVTRGDVNRLAPGQYLNDTLIEYGLKLWHHDLRQSDPELADQIHIFSSFFYKKLNIKARDQGYQSVRKWTSKFDIFKRKYIIVPINEHLHWYLAIICNPEYTLLPPASVSSSISRPLTRKRKRESVEAPDPVPAAPFRDPAGLSKATSAPAIGRKSPDIVPDSEEELERTQPTHPEPIRDETKEEWEVEHMIRACSIHDSAPLAPPEKATMDVDEFVDDPMIPHYFSRFFPPSFVDALVDADPPSSEQIGVDNLATAENKKISTATRFYQSISAKGKQRTTSPVPSYPDVPDDGEVVVEEPPALAPSDPHALVPRILIFDSLGSRHIQAINVLTGYLQMEAKDKKGLDEATKAVGKEAIVPYQPNFCDCGVYVLHFAKRFMEDPLRLTQTILTKTKKGYDHVARDADWNHEGVKHLREALLERTSDLAEAWKKLNAAERSNQDNSGAVTSNGVSTVDDSDDEPIIMVELSAPSVSAKARGKQRVTSPVPKKPAEKLHDESSVSTVGRPRNEVEGSIGGSNVDDGATSNEVSAAVDDGVDELIMLDTPPTPSISTRARVKRKATASAISPTSAPAATPAERFRVSKRRRS